MLVWATYVKKVSWKSLSVVCPKKNCFTMKQTEYHIGRWLLFNKGRSFCKSWLQVGIDLLKNRNMGGTKTCRNTTLQQNCGRKKAKKTCYIHVHVRVHVWCVRSRCRLVVLPFFSAMIPCRESSCVCSSLPHLCTYYRSIRTWTEFLMQLFPLDFGGGGLNDLLSSTTCFKMIFECLLAVHTAHTQIGGQKTKSSYDYVLWPPSLARFKFYMYFYY